MANAGLGMLLWLDIAEVESRCAEQLVFLWCGSSLLGMWPRNIET